MANARQVLLFHVAKVELGRGQMQPSKRWNRAAVNIEEGLVGIGVAAVGTVLPCSVGL
jgi:hypothetical protein